VHILQQNDQNLALANMAKSANDSMMTRIRLRGCSGVRLPRLRTVMVWETEVPSGVQG